MTTSTHSHKAWTDEGGHVNHALQVAQGLAAAGGGGARLPEGTRGLGPGRQVHGGAGNGRSELD